MTYNCSAGHPLLCSVTESLDVFYEQQDGAWVEDSRERTEEYNVTVFCEQGCVVADDEAEPVRRAIREQLHRT